MLAAAAILMVSVLPTSAAGQVMSPNAKYVPDPGLTLKVTVTISRWEGEKKVGSSPYVLMVVPSWGERAEKGIDGESTSLQMGGEYPLPTPMIQPGDGKVTTSLSYKTLGTNIRIAAKPADEGKFNLMVSVNDSQVEKARTQTQPAPSFQTFRAENRLTMRDGQTVQYTVATDAVTGQVVKLDVTVNVLK
jgi:hypothetical protein